MCHLNFAASVHNYLHYPHTLSPELEMSNPKKLLIVFLSRVLTHVQNRNLQISVDTAFFYEQHNSKNYEINLFDKLVLNTVYLYNVHKSYDIHNISQIKLNSKQSANIHYTGSRVQLLLLYYPCAR